MAALAVATAACGSDGDEASTGATTATTAPLAAMRSGIPSYTFDEDFQQEFFGGPETVYEPQQLVDLVNGDEPMFEPGTMMFHSNTDLVLLGMAIEQVADAPIEDVLADQIVGPLGIDDTFMPTDADLPEPHAQGYTMQFVDGDEPADATDWNPSWAWTAGGMISDLDDLLVWGEAQGAGEGILSPETQAERLSSFDFDVPVFLGPDRSAPQTPARAYGLGLGLANDWYGHEGELPGFTTYVQHDEPEGVTLVVMANSDVFSGSDCTEDQPTVPSNPGIGPCMSPASRMGATLADAVGFPLIEEQGSDEDGTTGTTGG